MLIHTARALLATAPRASRYPHSPHKFPPLIDAALYQSYFLPLCPSLPAPVSKIIKMLGEGGTSPNHIRNVLDKDLNLLNRDRPPTPMMVPLLAALHHAKLTEVATFSRRILEWMYRYPQVEEISLDELQTNAFIKESLHYDREIKDKIKWSLARYRVGSILRNNMHRTTSKNTNNIIRLLLHFGGVGDNLTVQGVRFAKIAASFHEKLREFWELVLQGSVLESKLASPLLISNAVKLYDMYPSENSQDAELLWRVVAKCIESREVDSFMLLTIHKYFGLEQDENGNWYKDKVLSMVMDRLKRGTKMD